MKRLIIVAAVLMLGGCAWVDKTSQLTRDEYFVVAGGNYRAWPEIKKDCYAEANSFCGAMGKSVETVNYTTHGVGGWTPQQGELTFKCI
jgi:hypothetical protein